MVTDSPSSGVVPPFREVKKGLDSEIRGSPGKLGTLTKGGVSAKGKLRFEPARPSESRGNEIL